MPNTAQQPHAHPEPQLRHLDAAFGREVLGLDLNKADAAACVWIRRALADHGILVFRGQNLDAARIAAFGRQLGTPRPHTLLKYRVKGEPNVSMVTNVDANGEIDPFGVSRAAEWHSDMTYFPDLPMLALLHALEVPAAKGGTLFADMRAAYDALPRPTKTQLDGLTAVHGDAMGPVGYRRKGSAGTQPGGDKEARHSAVRTHPVSGRQLLFVNPMHTKGFEGPDGDTMTGNAADELIASLTAHATQPQFCYYHQWQPGDVLIWDEASTMHRNAGDYDPTQRRIFMRTIVF